MKIVCLGVSKHHHRSAKTTKTEKKTLTQFAFTQFAFRSQTWARKEHHVSHLKAALSLTTSVEDFLIVFWGNIDAPCNYCERPYLRKWRFGCQCLRQSGLSNTSDELLSDRHEMVTTGVGNDMASKLRSKRRS